MLRPLITFATTLALLAALPVAAQVTPAKKKPVRRTAPEVAPLVLPPAPGEQLAAAALTHLGDYACEFDQSLRVSRNPRFDGYVDLNFDKKVYTLKPILSQTGALRLEDVRGRLLLVQIAVKSMLMDVKVGQRLVDDCVHEVQAENRRVLATAPPQRGLGIDPDKAAADAAGAPAVVAPTPSAGTAVPASTPAPAVAAPTPDPAASAAGPR